MDTQPERQRATFVRVFAEAVVMVALASALYLVKVFTLPQGGSVTLGSMIPILVLALRRGPKIAVASGVVFGIIVLYFEPFVYNPIQFLLDYPLAFGALGLAGFFRARAVIGVGVGIASRFLCHFVSGVVFFASFAPVGESPIVYSAVYNASYLIPEFAISASVMLVLLRRGILDIRR